MAKEQKIEFGDFQTPIALTDDISDFIKTIFPTPNIIIEPTCGLGSFVQSCKSVWGTDCSYYGFDVNPQYIEKCNKNINGQVKCHFELADFFQ